jgi:thaumarchaeosortase
MHIVNSVKRFVTRYGLLLLPILVPIVLLYARDPASFEGTWKGRSPYLFFLWLYLTELLLHRDAVRVRSFRLLSIRRKLILLVAMLAPTIYVLTAATAAAAPIVELGRVLGVPSGGRYGDGFLVFHWPLSLEFLVLTLAYLTVTWSWGDWQAVNRLSIALFFLSGIAVFFTLDTLFPFGVLTALQQFVPVTVNASAWLLDRIGYVTRVIPIADGSVLWVQSAERRFLVTVYWPCAGIHSLAIYTFTLLLFLRDMAIPAARKLVYFAGGAVGTFTVNVLRIVSICQLGVTIGPSEASKFHDLYGEMFFLIWLVLYVVAISVVEWGWTRRRAGSVASPPVGAWPAAGPPHATGV